MFYPATISWWTILLLYGYGIINDPRVEAYASLMTCFTMGTSAFSFAFGFVVYRSEYYGLPAFLLTTGLSVAGTFVANSTNISSGIKLFLSILSPQIGMTVGLFAIEEYFHTNDNNVTNMPFNIAFPNKNLPSLLAINAMIMMSAVCYGFIAWGMPFDWLFVHWIKDDSTTTTNTNGNVEQNMDIIFPCDRDEDEEGNCNKSNSSDVGDVASVPKSLLTVNSLTYVYPDGTNAVKNISFDVKEGQVLSFLGANGAGLDP